MMLNQPPTESEWAVKEQMAQKLIGTLEAFQLLLAEDITAAPIAEPSVDS
jgi:hypothetical protein